MQRGPVRSSTRPRLSASHSASQNHWSNAAEPTALTFNRAVMQPGADNDDSCECIWLDSEGVDPGVVDNTRIQRTSSSAAPSHSYPGTAHVGGLQHTFSAALPPLPQGDSQELAPAPFARTAISQPGPVVSGPSTPPTPPTPASTLASSQATNSARTSARPTPRMQAWSYPAMQAPSQAAEIQPASTRLLPRHSTTATSAPFKYMSASGDAAGGQSLLDAAALSASTAARQGQAEGTAPSLDMGATASPFARLGLRQVHLEEEEEEEGVGELRQLSLLLHDGRAPRQAGLGPLEKMSSSEVTGSFSKTPAAEAEPGVWWSRQSSLISPVSAAASSRAPWTPEAKAAPRRGLSLMSLDSLRRQSSAGAQTLKAALSLLTARPSKSKIHPQTPEGSVYGSVHGGSVYEGSAHGSAHGSGSLFGAVHAAVQAAGVDPTSPVSVASGPSQKGGWYQASPRAPKPMTRAASSACVEGLAMQNCRKQCWVQDGRL